MDYPARHCRRAAALIAIIAALTASPAIAGDITTEWGTVKPPPVPETVDGMSAEDPYNEQYAAWHLFKGGPVNLTQNVILTRSDLIKFAN